MTQAQPKHSQVQPERALVQPEHWYKQFWPWFLIILPSAVVVASFVSLNIAIKNADTPVHDDYSKQGFAIQHNANADQIAAQQNIRAAIAIDNSDRITVTLQGDMRELPALLTLHCIHKIDARRDITLALTRARDNTYTSALPTTAYGKWRIELRAPDASWRLSAEVDLQRNAQLQLPL